MAHFPKYPITLLPDLKMYSIKKIEIDLSIKVKSIQTTNKQTKWINARCVI